MASSARYYLARVIKIGNLTTEGIIKAIRNPTFVQLRGIQYTFTDFQPFGPDEQPIGVFARLAKYRTEGAVEVVRQEFHASGREPVENLIEASSPFVYLPEFSGIAYKHVWNLLERDQFSRAFCELIEASEQKFFMQCELEPVTDLRAFVSRLAQLEKIIRLQAMVKPPNPLFGPCWDSLRKYLEKRKLQEVTINEKAPEGISTQISKIAAAISEGETSSTALQEMMEPLLGGVGDAALLMAADGYGSGKVIGIEENRTVTIRTRDNQKSFLLDRDPDPTALFNAAYEQFQSINNERYLEHP